VFDVLSIFCALSSILINKKKRKNYERLQKDVEIKAIKTNRAQQTESSLA
jgi:hypothetical protein